MKCLLRTLQIKFVQKSCAPHCPLLQPGTDSCQHGKVLQQLSIPIWMLCGPPPNRLQTGTGPWPGGVGDPWCSVFTAYRHICCTSRNSFQVENPFVSVWLVHIYGLRISVFFGIRTSCILAYFRTLHRPLKIGYVTICTIRQIRQSHWIGW